MPKFYFLDGSLRSSVGHHDSLARLVLAAVERFGYVPVVGAHRRFDDQASVAERWQVEPAFTHSVYDDPLLMPPEPTRWDWRERWSRLCRHRRRTAQARAHANDLAALLIKIRPRQGDQVFFAAAAELVVQGLVRFLRSAALPDLDWHLLFHFNALVGRPPAADSQACRRKVFRRLLSELREVVPGGRLHFYATTEKLADEYRWLAAPLPVHVLAYPIEVASPTHARTDGPLRVLYAGEARLEKGFAHLPEVIRHVWQRIERGQLEFVIQANFNFKLPCRRRNLPLVRGREELERLAAEPSAAGRIRLITEAPSAAEYAQLVTGAQLGLLPYDGEHYYARCSGVLLEMLAAGVPVVVPANCALADTMRAGDPRQAAGQTFDDPALIAKALLAVVDDYERYAQSAQRLVGRIAQEHDARRLVATLLSHQAASEPRPAHRQAAWPRVA